MNNVESTKIPLTDATSMDEIAKAMASVKFEFNRPFRGLGKKAFIPLMFEFSYRLVQFFCEAAILESTPEDPDIGYTDKDVYVFAGALVFDKSAATNNDRPEVEVPSLSGEVLEFENFLTKYVDDPMIRVFLSRKMDDLKEAAALNEEAIQNINEMYMNREVGKKIVDLKVH